MAHTDRVCERSTAVAMAIFIFAAVTPLTASAEEPNHLAACPPIEVTCSDGLGDESCVALKKLVTTGLANVVQFQVSRSEARRGSICSVFKSSKKLRVRISEDDFDLDVDYTGEVATLLALQQLDLYWTGSDLIVRKQSDGTSFLTDAFNDLGQKLTTSIALNRELRVRELLTLEVVKRQQFNVRFHGREKSWILITISPGVFNVGAVSTGSRTVFSYNEAIYDIFPKVITLVMGAGGSPARPR